MRLLYALGATVGLLAIAGWLILEWVDRATPKTKHVTDKWHGRT